MNRLLAAPRGTFTSVPRALLAAFRSSYRHDVGGRAAQVAFYSLLAVFPGLITLVGVLAMIGVGDEVQQLFSLIRGSVPADTMATLESELLQLEHHSGRAVLFSAGLCIYYGSRALDGLLHGVAAADSDVHNPHRHLSLFALVASGVVLVGMFFLVGLLTVTGPALHMLQERSLVPTALAELIQALRWPTVALAFHLAVSGVYWLGAHQARFSMVSPGAFVATMCWLGLSLGYERVARGIGQLGTTYGSLAAAVGLLLYLHTLSSCVLLGAEIDGSAGR